MTLELQKLGIIAGGGDLPWRIAEACVARGQPCFVLAVEEFASAPASRAPSARNPISKLGRALATLRRNGCRDIVFAGKFERPVGRVRFNPDLAAAWFVARHIGLFRKSDDTLHRMLANEFERIGFRVVSPLEADPSLAAGAGLLTRTEIKSHTPQALARALAAAKEHGATDEGQAVVMREGAVIARETSAGTDSMLAALARANNRGGILAKAMKPAQTRQVDPPAIGESTIEAAAAAGLDGVVIEAGATVVVDKAAVMAAADRLGLFVYGERV